MAKTKAGPVRTTNSYPLDWTVTTEWTYNNRKVVPGTELSIRGEPGRFRFVKHVQTGAGAEWVDVWGGPSNRECYRAFRPERIRTVHRVNKTRANAGKRP